MPPLVSTTCFLSCAPLALGSLNDVALVALSITGSTLAAKRSAFVLVEDDAVTLRLPELWGAPWLRARKPALPHPVAIDPRPDISPVVVPD